MVYLARGRKEGRPLRSLSGEGVGDVVDWVLPGGRPDLRQTVALIGVESALPSVQAGFADHFRQALPGFLKKECAEAVIDEAAAGLKTPPRLPSGLLDGYALAGFGPPARGEFFSDRHPGRRAGQE